MAELATATEAVAEVAETVADQAVTVAEVSRGLSPREIRLVLAGGGTGLLIGSVVGVLIATKRLQTRYQEVAEEEITQMREHFRAKERIRQSEVEKPALDELDEVVETAGYAADGPVEVVRPETEETEPAGEDEAPIPTAPIPEPEVKNIFDDPDPPIDTWDQAEEEASRQEGVPYVIHKDEFGTDDELTPTNLTYYAGDDVLADAQDKPIDDQDKVVGVANLDKFGHGSQDAHVVFVRNEMLGLDLEVARSDQSFAEAVHGFRHSEPTRRSRPRWDE